jgi:hypothetical protein
MSFGGFLGIGEKYHPLPWSTLKYDERKGRPRQSRQEDARERADLRYGRGLPLTPDYGRQVDKYYNAPTYW